MKTTILIAIVLTVELFASQIAQAQGTIYVSSLSQAPNAREAIGGDSWLAQIFRTGINSDGYVLNSVQLLMDTASGSPGGFSVSIYSSLNPINNLGSLSGSDPSAGGVFNYTASGLTLLPSAYYFVVVTAATHVAQGVYNWSTVNSTSEVGGWDIISARYRSADGSSWTFEDRLSVFQMAVNATPVPEPQTYALAGSGLALLNFRWRKRHEFRRRHQPYQNRHIGLWLRFPFRREMIMRTTLQFFVGIMWLASRADGLAVVRYVPDGGTPNYPTIQAAITTSQTGDIVRVQPGTYHESIIFGSVPITLTSTNPGDLNVVQATVIQGDASHSVVTFDKGQTTNTLLTGFTIRGGGGTPLPALNNWAIGGGIFCSTSSPSIVGNIIEENHLSMSVPSRGGGIGCWGSSWGSAGPRIARNIIRNNSANYSGAFDPGDGAPLIEDNWIYNNTAVSVGAAGLNSQCTLLNNTIWKNTPNNLYIQSLPTYSLPVLPTGMGVIANNIIANSSDAAPSIYGPASDTPTTTFSSLYFRNNDVWETGVTNVAGPNGNIFHDPLFVNATNFDLHLSPLSPGVNAGDLSGLRSTNELDFDGRSRILAFRVDMGASEFHGGVANAGLNQTVYWSEDVMVALDGSASVDTDGVPLTFSWHQTLGPPVALLVTNSQAFFHPPVPERYQFELVVNDGTNDGVPASVSIVVTNSLPIASAGPGQSLAVVPEVLALDGSHSLDPQGQPLIYHWSQVGGPTVGLTSPSSSRPTFTPAQPGVYKFELTVSDPFGTSLPDRVTYYLGQVPPVANAGLTRYAGRTAVTLDGSGSFAPNNTNALPLAYAWRQASGPVATLSPTNVVNPVVSGFLQTSNIQELSFELVVKAGELTSTPSTVKVVIVPQWSNTAIVQINGTFNTNRPTIIAFGGGDCQNGNPIYFPPAWYSQANLFTCFYTYDYDFPPSVPNYYGYGGQMMVLLSAAAPGYNQPIQAVGVSTGGMPACDVAERFNITYRDPRYLVNRITFLDAGCDRDYNVDLNNLNLNRVPGKMFWVDNYYASAIFLAGTLNVKFPEPPAEHGTPLAWYFPSWTLGTPYSATNFNNGVFAGAFFSVVGPGKNYQLETGQSEYDFGWNPAPTTAFPLTNLLQMNPAFHPARLPGAVELTGPTNATLASENSLVFSCLPTLNAAWYQVLVGPDAYRVDQVAWAGRVPPNQPLSKLPFTKTWWTIRAVDPYGTTSWADPRYVLRDSDADGLSDEDEVLTYHTDPYNPDTDGDGHLDGQEVLAGTDPLHPNVGFQLTFRLASPNQLHFSWFSDSGNSYDLESSASLTAPSWQPIQTFAPTAAGLIQYTIPLPADAARFYRVRVHAVAGN